MSLSKNTEKYIRSLSQKKFRQQHNKFIGEGEKLVAEILQTDAVKVEILLATKEWWLKNEGRYSFDLIQVKIVEVKELRKVSQLKTPNQVLVVAKKISYKIKAQTLENSWSIYLDQVRDPGNMGTIIRIAEWFGVSHLFCSLNSADIYNPKVIQASMGAFLRIPIIEIELEKLLDLAPKIPTYATVLGATSVYEQNFSPKGILVMGNESKGIAEEQLAKLNHRISIPSYGKSQMESLNVAVATAVICGEIRRSLAP
ncbi:MAG: RNA methyltransferase [Bacteroidota bacterium]